MRDFEIQEIAPNFFLPVSESNHPVIHNALFRFCSILAIFQAFVLGMRIVFHSSIRRKANTVSSIFFRAGTAWNISYLVAMTINWIVVFGSFVALMGLCIVVQSVVVLIAGAAQRT